MSAQALELHLNPLWGPSQPRAAEEVPGVASEAVVNTASEVICLTLYGPEPTPEQLTLEYFLLECD